MSKRAIRNHAPAFKAKGSLGSIEGGANLFNYSNAIRFILTRLLSGSASF
jgi:hypothetical protein